MTEKELQNELNRIVEDEYPLITSKYIDQYIILKAAQKLDHNVKEWRGVGFPYKKLHANMIHLIRRQFMTTRMYDIYYEIGEYKAVDFLNNYYHWLIEEEEKMSMELENNDFKLSEMDIKDFEEFNKQDPIPCKEPLDIAGYLHMCRIAYDAAPKYAYPSFISDFDVVARAKFDECNLLNKDMSKKMEYGDSIPGFMLYHPEEMGFGGSWVRFEWSEKGWVLIFIGKSKKHARRDYNMDIHRFLALRRAGYPVLYRTSDY